MPAVGEGAPRELTQAWHYCPLPGPFGHACRSGPKVVDDDLPNDRQLHVVILVPQSVPQPSNVGPRWPRGYLIGPLTEPASCFTNALHAAFDRIGHQLVPLKGFEILSGWLRYVVIGPINIVEDVLQR